MTGILKKLRGIYGLVEKETRYHVVKKKIWYVK